MGSKSDYLENKVLDHVLSATVYTAPATTYIGLFTAAPSDSGGGTEVTGGSYARVSVTNNATNWPAASSGSKSNGIEFLFTTASANWGTIVAFGVFDASSAGNLLYWGGLTSARKVFTAATSDTVTCPAHGYSNGDKVFVEPVPGVSLPTGLSAGTVYFIISSATDTFQLSLSSGGAAVDITVAGAGYLAKLTTKDINSGDTARFPATNLIVSED
jgi:hypothetical protein